MRTYYAVSERNKLVSFSSLKSRNNYVKGGWGCRRKATAKEVKKWQVRIPKKIAEQWAKEIVASWK